jgi:hypothetical protein
MRSLDEKKVCMGLFLDFSKAFDTIIHNILLDKLSFYGIQISAINLIGSFLKNRKQLTKYNSSLSGIAEVEKGVPQGSILGPLIFLIYINDIVYCCSDFIFTIFADDTNILITGNNIDTVREKLLHGITELEKWIKSNYLKLNVNKTHCMNFHKSRESIQFEIFNKRVNIVENIKFLGVILDNKLTWNAQATSVSLKLSQYCGILFRIRRLLSKDTLICIYNSLIFSIILYCIPIWGNSYKNVTSKVQNAQKRIIRTICFSSKYDTTGPLFKSNNLLNLSSINIYFCSIFMFKVQNSMLSINNKFGVCDSRTRQSEISFKIPIVKTTLAQNQLFFSGVKIWNSLPAEVREIKSINVFKKKLKEYLLNKQ